MVERREPVLLMGSDHFTGRLQMAASAATDLSRRLARLDATWEPHDWSEFD